MKNLIKNLLSIIIISISALALANGYYILTPQDDSDIQNWVKIHRQNFDSGVEDKEKVLASLLNLAKKSNTEKARARNLAVYAKLKGLTDEYITSLKGLSFTIPQKMYSEGEFVWTIDPYGKTDSNSNNFACNQILGSHCIIMMYNENGIFYTNVHSLTKYNGKKPKNPNPTEFFGKSLKGAVVMIGTPMPVKGGVLFHYAGDYSSPNEKMSVINRMYYNFTKKRGLFGKVIEKSTIVPKNSTISIDECYSDEWMEILNIKNCNRKTTTSYYYYLHEHPLQDSVIPADSLKYNGSDIVKAFSALVK